MFSHGVAGGISQPDEGMKLGYFAHASISARGASATLFGVPILKITMILSPFSLLSMVCKERKRFCVMPVCA